MPYKDKSCDWLFFAESDLKSAQIMFREKIYHIASFHAQQVVEKSLKAFIVKQKDSVPKTHSLNRLYSLSKALGLNTTLKSKIAFMEQFYFPTRYPDALLGSLPKGLPTKADAERAIKIAENFFQLAKKLLRGKK